MKTYVAALTLISTLLFLSSIVYADKGPCVGGGTDVDTSGSTVGIVTVVIETTLYFGYSCMGTNEEDCNTYTDDFGLTSTSYIITTTHNSDGSTTTTTEIICTYGLSKC